MEASAQGSRIALFTAERNAEMRDQPFLFARSLGTKQWVAIRTSKCASRNPKSQARFQSSKRKRPERLKPRITLRIPIERAFAVERLSGSTESRPTNAFSKISLVGRRSAEPLWAHVRSIQ